MDPKNFFEIRQKGLPTIALGKNSENASSDLTKEQTAERLQSELKSLALQRERLKVPCLDENAPRVTQIPG